MFASEYDIMPKIFSTVMYVCTRACPFLMS